MSTDFIVMQKQKKIYREFLSDTAKSVANILCTLVFFPEQRELVLEHFKNRKLYRKIAVYLSSSLVQHIIEHFMNENLMGNNGQQASKLSQRKRVSG